MNQDNSHRYDDIIDLPHHRSTTRAHISNRDRAAQFAPFAALTGFGAAIQETARLTDHRPELDESEQEMLNLRLKLLSEKLDQRPAVTVTYFCPDAKKAGGAILTATGYVIKLNPYTRELLLDGGLVVPLEQLLHLESPSFSALE